ncbi:hypothetical protein IWGMT90018_04310 [Mycobacterium kiyosense]|nr:hypothetical protein IWGMT90018_04310 [Mycobacterium kiyosense]
MSSTQPRHAAPKPDRNTKSLRTVRFWLAPIVITAAFLAALSALYLGGILNPTTNLRHFPIAVVNQDAGPYGKMIADGLVSALDKDKFDVRVLPQAEAKQQLDRAQVYGEMVIPPGFSLKVRDLGESALTANRAERPTITVLTNPRAGTLGASIAGQTLTRAAATANSRMGERLSADVIAQSRWRADGRRGGARLEQSDRDQIRHLQSATQWHRKWVVGLLLCPAAVAGRLHRQRRGQHPGRLDAWLRTSRIRPGVPVRRAGAHLAVPHAADQVGG